MKQIQSNVNLISLALISRDLPCPRVEDRRRVRYGGPCGTRHAARILSSESPHATHVATPGLNFAGRLTRISYHRISKKLSAFSSRTCCGGNNNHRDESSRRPESLSASLKSSSPRFAIFPGSRESADRGFPRLLSSEGLKRVLLCASLGRSSRGQFAVSSRPS